MATPVGKSGGIPIIKNRNPGKISPIVKPYFHPTTIPHNNTGKCIGKSIAPNCGIFAVKNGRTKPKHRKNAAYTSLLVDFRVFSPLFFRDFQMLNQNLTLQIFSKTNELPALKGEFSAVAFGKGFKFVKGC